MANDTLEFTGGVVASAGICYFSSAKFAESSGADVDAMLRNISEMANENPEAALASTATGAVTSCAGTSTVTTEDVPDGIIEVFFRNQMPYTETEKRAEQVYGTLHGNNDDLLKKPVLIADSQDALKTIHRTFGNIRGEDVNEKLEFFEHLLDGLPH